MATKATKSSMAGIEGKTSTKAATAVLQKSLHTGKKVTGQWILSTFVNDKSQETKMNSIAGLVETGTEPADLKVAFKDARDQAKEQDAANGVEKGKQGPVYKTTANACAAIGAIYGALRFAEDEFRAVGFTDGMGYQKAYVLAQKALANAGLTWEGDAAETKEQREQRAQMKLMRDARNQAEKENPQKPGEDLIEYTKRISAQINEKMEELKVDNEKKVLDREVDKLLKLAPEVAQAIAETVLEAIKAQQKASAQANGTVH